MNHLMREEENGADAICECGLKSALDFIQGY